MANVLLGKTVADKATELLIERVAQLKEKGIEPTLAIVRVGASEDDLSYERGALKRAESGESRLTFALFRSIFLKRPSRKNSDDQSDTRRFTCLFRLFRSISMKEGRDTLRRKDVDGITSLQWQASLWASTRICALHGGSGDGDVET